MRRRPLRPSGEEPEPNRVPQERDYLVPPIRLPPTALGPGTSGGSEGDRQRYVVETQLGHSTVCVTYLARDLERVDRVVIKVVRPERVTASTADHFGRRAHVFAALGHANLLPLTEIADADGLLYYVRPYVQAETLANRLVAAPLPPREVEHLGEDLLNALEALHQRGIVHGSVKPTNIFFIEGRAVLTDPALVYPDAQSEMDYAPPERATGGDVTPQADLYALAIVLFEAFTARRWAAARQTDRPDWSSVPPRISRVLRRALASTPDERWPDVATFRDSLSRARSDWGILSLFRRWSHIARSA